MIAVAVTVDDDIVLHVIPHDGQPHLATTTCVCEPETEESDGNVAYLPARLDPPS